jgi:penicillin amidase
MPPQNLVAVDREGSIGWSIAGPIPRRRGFDGRTPTSWAGGERGWDGYLEPREVPVIRNPESGLIWTANNRLVDGDFLDRLGRGGGYAHGERARLIRDRLLAVEAADEAAMLDIQLEDRADALAVWRDLFLRSLDGAAGPLASEAARVLREGWTGRASVDSAAYPLVRNARVELFGAVYGPLTAPAAARLPNFSPWVAIHWPGPLLRLAQQAPAHFIPPGAADWNDALRRAVLAAAERMTAAGPLAGRTWGKENVVHVRHPLSAGLPPLLARFLAPYLDAPPRGLPGDSGLPRAQSGDHGPSNRFVVAPGREETGILHMPGGQSGHPGMPYYLSGHEDWEAGRATPFLAGATEWTLTLVPE